MQSNELTPTPYQSLLELSPANLHRVSTMMNRSVDMYSNTEPALAEQLVKTTPGSAVSFGKLVNTLQLFGHFSVIKCI